MPVEILVRPEIKKSLQTVLPKRTIQKTAETLLNVLECTEAELSLVFTGDSEMRQLNFEYRDKDKATDVLSFPQPEPGRAGLLGDVIISLDTALRQAEEFGHSVEKEVTRLLVHGVLHLLGYEHEAVEDAVAERMFAKEAEVLERLDACCRGG